MYSPEMARVQLQRRVRVSLGFPAAGFDDTLVLCYHAVGDEVGAGAFVSQHDLDWQLGLLVARGYRPATFTDAVLGTVGGRVLAVSFDDGHVSVLNEALPVLARHGLVGTVFPRLDELGRAGSLTLADLELLVAAGWEVGSHTLTHPALTTLADDEMQHELSDSKRTLERLLGIPCRSIAYPFGDADARVIAAVAAAGYEAGAALLGVPVAQGRLAWPRVGVHGREGRLFFRVRVCRSFRAVRGTARGARLVSGQRAL